MTDFHAMLDALKSDDLATYHAAMQAMARAGEYE